GTTGPRGGRPHDADSRVDSRVATGPPRVTAVGTSSLASAHRAGKPERPHARCVDRILLAVIAVSVSSPHYFDPGRRHGGRGRPCQSPGIRISLLPHTHRLHYRSA